MVNYSFDSCALIEMVKFTLLKLFEFLEPHMKHSSKLKDLKIAKKNILKRNKMFGIKGLRMNEYEKVLHHYPDLLHK